HVGFCRNCIVRGVHLLSPSSARSLPLGGTSTPRLRALFPAGRPAREQAQGGSGRLVKARGLPGDPLARRDLGGRAGGALTGGWLGFRPGGRRARRRRGDQAVWSKPVAYPATP